MALLRTGKYCKRCGHPHLLTVGNGLKNKGNCPTCKCKKFRPLMEEGIVVSLQRWKDEHTDPYWPPPMSPLKRGRTKAIRKAWKEEEGK